MNQITQQQREAIVRRAIAERDAILACRFADQCSEEGSCANGCEDRAPIAYLRATTQPDWLEVCQKDEPGAFPVFAAYQGHE